MRRAPILLLSGLILLLAALAGVWLLRFRLADRLVDRRLAEAGVPATYRLTQLDPFHQRIENVRIGDPAAPDLIAAQVDLDLGYGWTGPVVRSIRARGVRLRGSIDRTGPRFGALDRLLPRSGGRTVLPDLDLGLDDARVSLATPVGALTATLDGAGSPQRLFSGKARLAAPALALAGCRLTNVRADLSLTARRGAPEATGPALIARTACPDLALGPGRLDLTLRSDAGFRRFAGRAAPSGFGGRARDLRFAGIGGTIDAEGNAGAAEARGRLTFSALSIPAGVRAVLALPDAPDTPIGPTLARARAGFAALLYRSDAAVEGRLVHRDGGTSADIARLTLTGPDGARIAAVAAGGLAWLPDGLRLDGDVTTGGGALPALQVSLRQPAPGAPITGVASLAPYRADDALLALPRARFDWTGGRLSFAGRARLDGPLAGGSVRGLDLPLDGRIDPDGRLTLAPGCRTLAAASATLASVTFTDLRLPVCGAPLVSRGPGGVRIAGRTGALRLHGRTGDGTPVAVTAAATTLTERGFTVRDLAADIGATRLAVARLDGTLALAGAFTGATARIGTVPLRLDEGAGRWSFADGALRLTGGLRVGDMADAPRFNPLAATDATLTLRGGTIDADATLREPASRATVATVVLTHDLSRGVGHATLTADTLRFTPKGLQPEAITPVTLGVIANVAGTVTGSGRIDWTPQGVTSTGAFGTDGMDLAAAFGPVTGLKGRIVFTDLLGLVSAPDQMATVAEINPGVPITNGTVRFQLPGETRLAVDDAVWPFASGTLRLDPAVIDLAADRERRLTFRLDALDAGAFVQQLDLPNVSATGIFDGVLPMVFGQTGGRIEGGRIAARPPGGTLAYVGELTAADIGTMGKLAFDALKAIRYSALTIDLDGQLDGEMVSRVRFTGVREATPEQSLVTRLIKGLPFRFNIAIRAPFRGLIGTARTYADPSLLLRQAQPPVQPPASGGMR